MPQQGGKGEFYLYRVNNNNDKIICFSNNNSLHSNQGAIIGKKINKENVDIIVQKILEVKS